jgi:hypothetical protein
LRVVHKIHAVPIYLLCALLLQFSVWLVAYPLVCLDFAALRANYFSPPLYDPHLSPRPSSCLAYNCISPIFF